MDTKLTGIINPGDTGEIRDWVEKQIGSLSDRKNEMADIKMEIASLRHTVDVMDKKIDNIERILKKAED
jgi:hypothetical protein